MLLVRIDMVLEDKLQSYYVKVASGLREWGGKIRAVVGTRLMSKYIISRRKGSIGIGKQVGLWVTSQF